MSPLLKVQRARERQGLIEDLNRSSSEREREVGRGGETDGVQQAMKLFM